MTQIQETTLPGVGVRHEFEAAGGDRIGVVTYHSGRREVVFYDAGDVDTVAANARLTPDEARLLAELLGGATVVERLDDLRQRIAGLAIDWLPIASHSPYAGARLGETELRSRTGVSIVAIVRGDGAIPAPGPEDLLEGGDTVVVVGTAEGIDRAAGLLSPSDA